MTLAHSLVYLLVGFVLLIWSADRLVAGASALARNFGISALLVGVLIVGFGTSAPELLVSAVAAFEGNPSLAVGNALGSNIANIALILGLTGLIYPMMVEPVAIRRELPLVTFASLLTGVLMLDGVFSRLDGAVLLTGLILFVGWMVLRVRASAGEGLATEELFSEIARPMSNRQAVIWTGVGLVLLPLSAEILVDGAVGLAVLMGVSEAVIGLTLVALGTSLPELAAATVSALRKEDDLAIGNILGSNLFNLFGVLGIAALVSPMIIEPILIQRDLPVMLGVLAMLGVAAIAFRRIGRVTAALLLVSYVVYQFAVFAQAAGSGG